jgi:hypothetical protein
MIYETIKEIIINGTAYSGMKKAGSKSISGSALSSDLLPLYLKYKYGYDDVSKIEKSTIGTLIHMGLEQIFKNHKDFTVEKSLSTELNNEWKLTGSIDLINQEKGYLIDWKHVGLDRILKDINKNGKYADYALQMGVYKALAQLEYNKPFKAYLGVFDPTQSYFAKDTPEDVFSLTEVNTFQTEDILEVALEKTNKLQEYIDTNIEPPQCENLLWSRKHGKARPMKCKHYCNVSNNCKYMEKFKPKTPSGQIKDLLGL